MGRLDDHQFMIALPRLENLLKLGSDVGRKARVMKVRPVIEAEGDWA
jgi:hypothetical protein